MKRYLFSGLVVGMLAMYWAMPEPFNQMLARWGETLRNLELAGAKKMEKKGANNEQVN